MTRCTIALISFFFCLTLVPAGPHGLPSGEFSGTGHWTAPDGSSGEYAVETRIGSDTIQSRYEYASEAGDRSESFRFRLEFHDATNFDVYHDGAMVGDGFCYEGNCFYRAELQGIVLQEHVRAADDGLRKFGSKSGPGFRVVWKEALDRR